MKKIIETKFSPHHVFGSFIEITSEEQFVPLFLAFMNNKKRIVVSTTPSGEYLCTDGSIPRELADSDKDQVKEFYLKDAEAWGIKKYSLYLDVMADGTPTTRIHHWELINPHYMPDNPVQYERGVGIISAPYYGAIIHLGMYTTLNSRYLLPKSVSLAALTSDFVKSNFLIIVKAKHLNYIRTCFLFDVKADIPVSDIKCLRVPVLNNTLENYFNQLRPMLTELDMIVEFVSYHEINKYLIGPAKKLSTEQIVGNIKRNYNNLVNFKPVVFND